MNIQFTEPLVHMDMPLALCNFIAVIDSLS